MIRLMDQKLYLDPYAINIKDYLLLLDTHTELTKKLEKEGWPNDKTRMAEETQSYNPEKAGSKAPPRVDTGVLPEDTFTA